MSLKLPKATLCVPCAIYLGVMTLALLGTLTWALMHSPALRVTVGALAAAAIISILIALTVLKRSAHFRHG
jgi:hypothetical protein